MKKLQKKQPQRETNQESEVFQKPGEKNVLTKRKQATLLEAAERLDIMQTEKWPLYLAKWRLLVSLMGFSVCV